MPAGRPARARDFRALRLRRHGGRAFDAKSREEKYCGNSEQYLSDHFSYSRVSQ
jgi:hypothetical protein